MTLVNSLEMKDLVKREFERKEDLRGYFFRDATAIIHSYPFRRLKHKTQVFFSPRNDHICTRIEHVLHVATISVTLCKALGLDVDLAWAISLGHDLGHTPFGHVGETILDDLLKDRGGFIHELYSLRVVDHLINYGKGINLTYGVRDGIVNHCGEKFEQYIKPDFTLKDLRAISARDRYPSTWEGVVVRMSDKIAYLGRDLEDAIQLDLVSPEEVPEKVRRILGTTNSDIIDTLVTDVISVAKERGVIGLSNEVFSTVLELKEFNYTHIYTSSILVAYHAYFERILKTLFQYLNTLFETCQFDKTAYLKERNLLAARFGDYAQKMRTFYEQEEGAFKYLVTDYIAGMTDDYAIDCVKEIMVPKSFESQFMEYILDEKA